MVSESVGRTLACCCYRSDGIINRLILYSVNNGFLTRYVSVVHRQSAMIDIDDLCFRPSIHSICSLAVLILVSVSTNILPYSYPQIHTRHQYRHHSRLLLDLVVFLMPRTNRICTDADLLLRSITSCRATSSSCSSTSSCASVSPHLSGQRP